MWSLNFDTINGMMLGIEFPTLYPVGEPDDELEIAFTIQIDLLILRIIIMRFNVA